ncbi:sulfite exporter TauE/SafE family protein [Lentilactobacillus kefiri]|uniref:sulfite exporter TauE/SafE family protein n=1 Tax=Lentilactobacillus kefiri TaxID=33962 RepID=UPI0012E77743|nr:sulfite exporter TauE/SafE family protein [Lentilactobacillus kefiri]QGV24811.1 sulfite exporter TauE/SafE family protein [Lentilactobacillus kefiri]
MSIIYLIITGFIIGTIVITLGGGGAAFYLGILTMVFGLGPASAAATSLVTSFPSLLIGSYSYFRLHKIKLKIAWRMIIFAVPAVVVGSLLSPHIPAKIYSFIIGGILAILGIQTLFSKQDGHKKPNKWLAPIYGVISGLMVGIGGLSGGGPVVAGLLVMGTDMVTAAATSSLVLVVMTATGLIFHLSAGNVDWSVGLGLMFGAIMGSFLAPVLLGKLDPKKFTKYVKPILGVLLVVMGTFTAFK